MKSKRWLKLILGILIYVGYQELTIRWAPGPPLPDPPSTPAGNDLLHLATFGSVLGYGAWRMWKK